MEGPVVSGFSGRGFRVDDGVYEGLLLTPSRAEGWAPPPLEALTPEAFAPLLALDRLPEFVLLGTGSKLRRPSPALEAALPFGIEVMDSRAAARAWGVLRGELRWIAALLYPLD
ncbi:MTH938/NDUFAF3 family protein [Sphingomonas sp. ST-64]|uniref:MTH938/NDUFAF3 family protein n=1 Tax=Sphingomonas plantiphila TaxID=3163295 RepID=A0ABW8YMV2_9SPHN